MGEYNLITNNRFALSIDEDEDLYELLEKQQAEKKRKEELAAEQAAKAAASKGRNDKKGSARPANKKVVKTTETNSTTTQQTSKPAYRNDENRPPRFARQVDKDNQNFEKPPREFDGQRGGRGRGGFGGRGGRGGGFGNRTRREFERHSGSDKTGVKAVEKRDGSGPHNWGDEIEAQLAQPEDQQKDTTEPLEESTENVEAETEPVEEEVKELTLDEWKAAQAQSKVKQDFKVRKANEGTDSKQWKGTVALEKKKKGDESGDEEEELSDDEPEVNATKETLEKLNIQITFADSGRSQSAPRGRGGRGGRGFGGGSRGPRAGGRGGRGGFGGRQGGDGSKTHVPRVDNEADFPSLGSR